MIEVPQPLAEAILRYLASKPYAEVAGIIAELQACRSEGYGAGGPDRLD